MTLVTLNVTIPEPLYQKESSNNKDSTQEPTCNLILEAIEQRLQTEKERLLHQLTEGYQATREEDILLAKDF